MNYDEKNFTLASAEEQIAHAESVALFHEESARLHRARNSPRGDAFAEESEAFAAWNRAYAEARRA